MKKCPQGHEITVVKIAGGGMQDACACTGYESINTAAPYLSRKAKIKTGGKARIWFEKI